MKYICCDDENDKESNGKLSINRKNLLEIKYDLNKFLEN